MMTEPRCSQHVVQLQIEDVKERVGKLWQHGKSRGNMGSRGRIWECGLQICANPGAKHAFTGINRTTLSSTASRQRPDVIREYFLKKPFLFFFYFSKGTSDGRDFRTWETVWVETFIVTVCSSISSDNFWPRCLLLQVSGKLAIKLIHATSS